MSHLKQTSFDNALNNLNNEIHSSNGSLNSRSLKRIEELLYALAETMLLNSEAKWQDTEEQRRLLKTELKNTFTAQKSTCTSVLTTSLSCVAAFTSIAAGGSGLSPAYKVMSDSLSLCSRGFETGSNLASNYKNANQTEANANNTLTNNLVQHNATEIQDTERNAEKLFKLLSDTQSSAHQAAIDAARG